MFAMTARFVSELTRQLGRVTRFRRKQPLGADYVSAFDVDHYRKQTSEADGEKSGAAEHYRRVGWRRGLDPNPFFSTSWYLNQYPDVASAEIDALEHYLRLGAKELRDPGPGFSTAWYLGRYRDVRNAGVNPLTHFLQYGRNENRKPVPSDVMRQLASEAPLMLTRLRATDFQPDDAPLMVTRLRADDFHPNADLTIGAENRYEAVAYDPQLICVKPMPAGFYRLVVSCKYFDIRPAAANEAALEIFIDQGDGFRAADVYRFPIDGSALDLDTILFAESEIKSLRLDPINTYCSMRLTFELSALSVREALPRLYKTFVGARALAQDREMAFIDRLRWDNASDFVHELSGPVRGDEYSNWIVKRRIGRGEREEMRQRLSRFAFTPTFDVVMPTYQSDLRFLKKAIDSVRTQIYPHWTLCIVDDGSGDRRLAEFLLGQAKEDERIIVRLQRRNAGISAASNEALKLGAGAFVALFDHDDALAPHALFRMAEALNGTPDADMLYSDEDKIDVDDVRSGPFFKPDWSPEFFLSCMYTCHLGVYRRSLVEKVGGFRSEFDFAQDYDLAFRVSAAARKVVHVHDVLYHWRTLPTSTAAGASAKPTAEHAARRAVQAHVDAAGLSGVALDGALPGTHRVKLELIGTPKVSIVIPTAARRIAANEERWFLLDLLRSIKDRSTYENIEIVIVENGDVEAKLERELSSFDLHRVLYKNAIFNISDKLNMGVEAASGEYVILLNDDMTVITNDWIEELISWVQRPGIVASGPKLLFPDDRVQHAGIVFLAQGPSHVYYGAADVDAGLAGSAVNIRNYSAVTGACLAVKRETYLAVGGFDNTFRVNFNDVDFCLKLGRLGRIVYTPYAKLYHYESVSKDEAPSSELRMFNERWAEIVGFDSFYSQHLSQSTPNAVTWNPAAVSERPHSETPPTS